MNREEILNKKSTDVVNYFINMGLISWETFLQLGDNIYSIHIERLSQRRIKKLKEGGYIE